MDTSVIWDKCLEELKYQVKDSVFTMWLRPLSAQVFDDQLVVHAPNQYFVTHVSKHHLADIEKLVQKHSSGNIASVVIRVDTSTMLAEPNNSDQSQSLDTAQALEKNKVLDKKSTVASISPINLSTDKSLSYLNPLFTFETFVSGKSNVLAYKACFDLGKRQSQSQHNPLFIYGASGLGKTHLMHSVAHRYLKLGKTFYYFSSEKFINQLVYALRNQKIEEFKKKIKRVDLLIIDDVHVLAGKTKSSSEFLSLFADFMVDGKQIILASDRHPSQMTEFDERFRSRFSWGLTVAVESPEMETRMQILQKKAKLSGVELPKECALFIAQNVVSNVRRLEGALNQVLANANLTGQPIDLDMVQYALKDIIAMRVQSVSMDNIRKVVAEYYDVSLKDLMGKKRTRSIARPRQIAMALARELTGDSYPDIGQSFGGRDHTTVMHACDKVAQLRNEDPVLDKEYKALAMTLQAG
ncbi:chromosomal replication initiator protein DnaA [Psychrobacter sp. I-STPA10]|uniref:chromosomal replication initiator protein DnaA n=1 Tax=Psychrobacter sp. I-STPA10 TaxID=2585769 RepID=UPI001E51B4EA|nr:chromosomal replication initiator protein DnaA [Psychrobacter sp. I-STPA10]